MLVSRSAGKDRRQRYATHLSVEASPVNIGRWPVVLLMRKVAHGPAGPAELVRMAAYMEEGV